jgi:phosphoribosylaminoimidazole-succinocarboxamide synthase
MSATPLLHAEIPGVDVWQRGKVRDSFDLGDRLLVVATDRVSTFDVVMNEGIPGKGELLTRLSAFWFQLIDSVVPTHFIRLADGSAADELPFALPPALIGRSMIVRKAQRIDAECIVRGYLAGTGWQQYSEHGTVCGQRLMPDLEQGSQLPQPIFTPSSKAADGEHDQNISYTQFEAIAGKDIAHAMRLRALATYTFAAAYVAKRGLILADTKFEFGLIDGETTLIDEVLTPDSSRFWPKQGYAPGRPQPSFDKQFLRDWVEATGWNKRPPPPPLPPEVIEQTRAAYQSAYDLITGPPTSAY